VQILATLLSIFKINYNCWNAKMWQIVFTAFGFLSKQFQELSMHQGLLFEEHIFLD
jgi:hypothetical protein